MYVRHEGGAAHYVWKRFANYFSDPCPRAIICSKEPDAGTSKCSKFRNSREPPGRKNKKGTSTYSKFKFEKKPKVHRRTNGILGFLVAVVTLGPWNLKRYRALLSFHPLNIHRWLGPSLPTFLVQSPAISGIFCTPRSDRSSIPT